MSRILACVVLAAAAPMLVAQATAAPAAPLLPHDFAGWSGVPAKDAAAAPSPAEAAVLKEDGLARSESATYASGSASLMVHAWEFKDATGAYGAFTFYRQPQMQSAAIGNEG